MDKKLGCPFGIEARFCKHQESYARDTLSAMKGHIVFFCKLDNPLRDCPRLKNSEVKI